MKKLIAMALISVSAFATNSGHIHFQSASTWVNPLYSKSLCFDGETFYASVRTCLESRETRSGQICMQYGKKTISQPAYGTKKVCSEYRGRGGNCVSYDTASYYQSPVREVKIYDDRGNRVVDTKTITVPSCN